MDTLSDDEDLEKRKKPKKKPKKPKKKPRTKYREGAETKKYDKSSVPKANEITANGDSQKTKMNNEGQENTDMEAQVITKPTRKKEKNIYPNSEDNAVVRAGRKRQPSSTVAESAEAPTLGKFENAGNLGVGIPPSGLQVERTRPPKSGADDSIHEFEGRRRPRAASPERAHSSAAAAGASPGRHCHSTLSLTVIACHVLGI